MPVSIPAPIAPINLNNSATFNDRATEHFGLLGEFISIVGGAGGLLTPSDIVGPVSQSGGIPTGAIIESGSNPLGRFVRFADGTQICTHAISATYNSPIRLTEDWTFPAPFINGEVVPQFTVDIADFIASANSEPGVISNISASSVSSTSVRVNIYANQSIFATGDHAVVYVTAHGRWF